MSTPHRHREPGALVRAVRDKDRALMLELLQQGADVNESNDFGNTALIWAAVNGWADDVRLLVSRGARIDAKNTYGDTALTRAAGCGHADVVRVLLDAGADIDVVTVTGRTALMEAEKNGYALIVDMLRAAPAERLARKQESLRQEYQKIRGPFLNLGKGPRP